MIQQSTIPEIAPDPDLEGARGLLGPEADEVLDKFLRRRGWDLAAVRAVQALYRPGSSLLVRYRVRAINPDGRKRVLSLCAETRSQPKDPLPPPEDFVTRYGLADPVETVSPYLVWAFPYDPSLRWLPEAGWGPSVQEALTLGDDRPVGVRAQPLRYRPRRRAIFRYTKFYPGRASQRRCSCFCKVLRTTKAHRSIESATFLAANRGFFDRILRRESRVRLSLPIAALSRNALLFDPLPGRSLRDLLIGDESLPDPRKIAALLRELGNVSGSADWGPCGRHERPASEMARATADLLAHLVPEGRDGISAVVDAVDRGSAEDEVPRRVVHGDLYEAQVFVDDDFSIGLIDVDDVGIGDPALDAANFCAHLLALAISRPAAKARLLAYRSLARQAFVDELELSERELAWREALVMLQLATGPFRVLDARWPAQVRRRIDIAARLGTSAFPN